jgi:DUF2933 family protein
MFAAGMSVMDHGAFHDQPGGFFSSRWNIGLIVLLAVAGFYLVTEHQAHLFGALPFLLILACPLMHFFMHGGHGGHGGSGDDRGTSGASQPPGAHQH